MVTDGGTLVSGANGTDDDDLVGLDHELRERVAEEFRVEAEEGERLAALAALRSRDLPTVGAELRDRGDRVAVEVADRTYLGTVVHVGADLIQLRTASPAAGSVGAGSGAIAAASSVVDVNLGAPVALRLVERVTEGGVGPGTGPETFRARLLELELAHAEVELTAEALPGVVRGRLEVVARDHVVLADPDASPWYVPIATITTVRSRTT